MVEMDMEYRESPVHCRGSVEINRFAVLRPKTPEGDTPIHFGSRMIFHGQFIELLAHIQEAKAEHCLFMVFRVGIG